MQATAASRILIGAMTVLALAMPIPGSAIIARPPEVVGPPMPVMIPLACVKSIKQPNGSSPGAAVPFPALRLGAPVVRTRESFTTGGGGTSNAAIEAQRRAAGLPYKPPTVDGEKPDLPATFAAERGQPSMPALYQRLLLAPSKRIAQNYGLIFSQATSPTRGRIVALTLYLAQRPTAPPRYRMKIDGSVDPGCRGPAGMIDVYAPAMTVAQVSRFFKGSGCSWTNRGKCPTRADWPRGRVLFVTPAYGNVYEYRWIDYDMLADWYFAGKR